MIKNMRAEGWMVMKATEFIQTTWTPSNMAVLSLSDWNRQTLLQQLESIKNLGEAKCLFIYL